MARTRSYRHASQTVQRPTPQPYSAQIDAFGNDAPSARKPVVEPAHIPAAGLVKRVDDLLARHFALAHFGFVSTEW